MDIDAAMDIDATSGTVKMMEKVTVAELIRSPIAQVFFMKMNDRAIRLDGSVTLRSCVYINKFIQRRRKNNSKT